MKVSDYRLLTEEEWEVLFMPIQNHLEAHSPRSGDMFETFGEELEYVLSHENDKIWTWIEDIDENKTYIVNGFHHINRIGYFICQNAWFEGAQIEVTLDW